MAYLEIHDALGVREVELEATSIVAGRDSSSDLVLADRRCSKQHCRFELKNSEWRVVDLASANGTYVEGAVISQVILKDGDEVEIGETLFVFRAKRPSVAKTDPIGAKERGDRSKRKNRLALVGAGCVAVIALLVLVMKGGSGASGKVDEGGQAEVHPTPSSTPEAAPENAQKVDPLVRASFDQLRAKSSSMILGDLLTEAKKLAEQSSGTPLGEEIATWREGVDRNYRGRYQVLCENLEKQISGIEQEAAGQGDGTQVAKLGGQVDELLLELRANGLRKLEKRMRRSKLQLLNTARGLWARLKNDAEAHIEEREFSLAREDYELAARSLVGTNFENQAKSELTLLVLKESIAKSRPLNTPGSATNSAGTASATALSRSSNGLIRHITAAEKAAVMRDWEGAAQAYDKALTAVVETSLTERWQWRRDLFRGLARLKTKVVIGVNEENRRVKTVKIGRLSARPFAADQNMVQLKFGANGEVVWKWREIPQGRLLDLLSFAIDDSESRLDYARAAIEFGNDERAMAMLLKVAKKAEDKGEADDLYAAWRGIAVPPGGFMVAAGSFLTPEEYANYESAIAARKLAKKVVSARAKQLEEIVAQLRALGTPGAEPLQQALRTRYENRMADAKKLSLISRPNGARQTVLKRLDERRADAFALIFDTTRYPYPYGPNQKEVQAEVDGLIEAVRSIYDHPSSLFVEEDKGLRQLYGELKEICSYMKSSNQDVPSPEALLAKIDQTLDMRSYGRSDSDRKKNAEVLTFNAEIKSSITPMERECHRLTNEYRMLMGLKAVKIEETLVLAARGHSQEMKDLGYFDHDSPTKGRTKPSQRAQLAGWSGSCSENIARGQRNALAAVNGWIGSSGHHRNILGRGWTHLGCGKAKDGFFWTQNFAKGASTKLSKEKIEPKTEQ